MSSVNMESANMESAPLSGPEQYARMIAQLREAGILRVQTSHLRPVNRRPVVHPVVHPVVRPVDEGNRYFEVSRSAGTVREVYRPYRNQRPVYVEEESLSSDESTVDISIAQHDDNSDVEMEDTQESLNELAPNMSSIAIFHDQHDDAEDMAMSYDSCSEDTASSRSASEQEEYLEKMFKFYPGERERLEERNKDDKLLSSRVGLSQKDVDDFYAPAYYSDETEGTSQSDETDETSTTDMDAEVGPESFLHQTTFEHNNTVDEFIDRWMPREYPAHCSRTRRLNRTVDKMMAWQPPVRYQVPEIPYARKGDFRLDLQQIPWSDVLGVSRGTARAMRDHWYKSYHNVTNSHAIPGTDKNKLPSSERFFYPKAMFTTHKARIEHFQLRNLMSVPHYDTYHFANSSKIHSYTTTLDDSKVLIDLTKPDLEAGIPRAVQIASMKSRLGLVVAGGFCGEYALKSANGEGAGVKGLVTPGFNDGITNHVDIIPNRTGGSPICVFASNERHLRTMDTETNIFTSDFEMSHPINCTSTSPDGRLRVVSGDSPEAWVIEAETGRPVRPLRGHLDYGFACAWSPDMRHIATSNQDKTLKIWDARTWRLLETIDSDVAGYRSLRFSPAGGGPRVLLCSEPADRISIIDAQLYQSRQVHNFFGEIAGADFSPDGNTIWVANTDPHFGGFMQYDRLQWGNRYGLSDLANEWLPDDDLDDANDPRCMYNARERNLRFLRTLANQEYDNLLPYP